MTAVPKHYKKNVFIGDLYRVKYLSSNFEQEVRISTDKVLKAGCPFSFIDSITEALIKKKMIF